MTQRSRLSQMNTTRKLNEQQRPIFEGKTKHMSVKFMPSPTLHKVFKQYKEDVEQLYKWDQEEKERVAQKNKGRHRDGERESN